MQILNERIPVEISEDIIGQNSFAKPQSGLREKVPEDMGINFFHRCIGIFKKKNRCLLLLFRAGQPGALPQDG